MFRGNEDPVSAPNPQSTKLIRPRLFRYHEELNVRDARARGREEGRAEVSENSQQFDRKFTPALGMAGSRTLDGRFSANSS